ncbi:MAG TPA: hypothetical protein VGG22_04785 [Candidatus Baltobacteraceae bacterium]|jgi:hypothetical protein
MRAAPAAPPAPAPASNVATPAPRRPTPRARTTDGVDQSGNTAQQSEIQLALAAQAARFDAMMKVLAEQQREINAIIDLGMAQTKRDDQLMNEWIRLI